MKKASKLVFVILESVIMGFSYWMAAEAWIVEMCKCLAIFLIVAIIMNVLIYTRTIRWSDPDDIIWLD